MKYDVHITEQTSYPNENNFVGQVEANSENEARIKALRKWTVTATTMIVVILAQNQ